jgi:hypothetical protein
MSLLPNWQNSDLFDSLRDKTNDAINTIGNGLISSTDTEYDYLINKLQPGSAAVTITQTNGGGNETLEFDVPGLSDKLDSSQILIANTSAVGPTTFQTETTLLTLTPSASLDSAKMKITFMGYVTNGAGSVAGSTIKIKKNGVEVSRTATSPAVGAQENFCLIWITSYSAGDIITATAQCSNTQNANYYTLICESFDAV